MSYLDTLASATTNKYAPEAVDNITKGSAFMSIMALAGKMLGQDGGLAYQTAVEKSLSSNGGFYSYYDELRNDAQDILAHVEYSLKNYACPVVISDQEEQENKGEAQIVKLLKTLIKNAEKTITDKIGKRIMSASATGAKEFDSLPYTITATDGTVGGIVQSTDTWFRPLRIVAGTTTGFTASTEFATVGLKIMRRMINATAFGNDTATAFIMGLNAFESYESEADVKEVIYKNDMSKKLANLGFEVLEYKGRPIVYDRWADSSTTTEGSEGADGTIYCLNDKHLRIQYNKARWFFMDDFVRISSKVRGKSADIVLSMCIAADNLRSQAVATSLTYTAL